MTDYTLIKQALQNELVRVTADLETIALYNESTDDWEARPAYELEEADPNSEADGVEEWNERNATVVQLEVSFQNIKRALEKIETDTFGICEICEGVIESARLAFLPTARTCVEHIDDERTLSL
jgi:RNA polymerase-binding transcription factor DksA